MGNWVLNKTGKTEEASFESIPEQYQTLPLGEVLSLGASPVLEGGLHMKTQSVELKFWDQKVI